MRVLAYGYILENYMRYTYKVVVVKQDTKELEKALNAGYESAHVAANPHCFVYILRKA